MKKKQKVEVDAAFDRMASLVEYGHLLASSEPPVFLNTVCDEIERLRSERTELLAMLKVFHFTDEVRASEQGQPPHDNWVRCDACALIRRIENES